MTVTEGSNTSQINIGYDIAHISGKSVVVFISDENIWHINGVEVTDSVLRFDLIFNVFNIILKHKIYDFMKGKKHDIRTPGYVVFENG